MNFNEQVMVTDPATADRGSVFKPEVKVKFLRGDNPVFFQILPAYDYTQQDVQGKPNPMGWVPFRLPNGDLTQWGALLFIARFIGHGQSRRDFLSPTTFGGRYCPIAALYRAASQGAEWQYLLEDRKDAKGAIVDRAAIKRAGRHLVMNVVEVDTKEAPQVVLACMTPGATKSLLGTQQGLAFAINGNATQEVIEKDYLSAFAYGDLTNPFSAPVLAVTKGQDKGQFSSYMVIPARSPMNNLIRRQPIPPELLPNRYNLTTLEQYVTTMKEDEIIAAFVQLFNQRSPQGYHEYELLKNAFGDLYRIPDPPAAPAATRTVQAGFGPSPVLSPASVPGMAIPGPMTATAGGEGAFPMPSAVPVAAPSAVPAAAPAAAAVPAAGPVAPGDAVPQFDRAAFMARLQQMGQKK